MQYDGRTNRYKWKMRFILFAVTALMIMAGCSKVNAPEPAITDTPAEDHATEKPDGKTDQQALLEQFQEAVKEAEEAADVIAFLNTNIANADQVTADTMLRGLHVYYDTHLEAAQNAFFTASMQDVLVKEPWPITEETAASIQDEAVRKLVQTALNGGYKLEMVEGSIYPIVDYSYQKGYSKHLSEQMKAFVELQAVESDKVPAKDGGLIISWDELAERALLAEAFMTKYKDSPESGAVQNKFVNSYLMMYINGLVNTPIYDLETFKLLDEAKASYQKTVAEAPQSVTGRITARFLDVLASTDDRIFTENDGEQTEIPAIKQFRDGLVTEAEELLKRP